MGRIRTPNNKNAPRTIDLDISFWDNMTCYYTSNTACSTNTWSVPDPDILKHAHVIIPLVDVTPEFIHPLVKKPLKAPAQELCGKDNFRSFFPVVTVLSAKEVLSDGVERWNVPGATKSGNIIHLSHTQRDQIEETLGAWGRLNLLVNNASQFHSSKVENVTEEEWHENINSNLSAPFFLSQVSCSCFHSLCDKQMTNTRTHSSLLSIECSSCKLKCFTSFCLAYVFRLFYNRFYVRRKTKDGYY